MGPKVLRSRVDVLGTRVLNDDDVGLNVLKGRDDIIDRDKSTINDDDLGFNVLRSRADIIIRDKRTINDDDVDLNVL